MAYEGMLAETVSIIGDKGQPISAYVARPLGPGPFPGMVLLPHAPGWDEWYRETTRKFAHHGYAAISHNLYHRAGQGKADAGRRCSPSSRSICPSRRHHVHLDRRGRPGRGRRQGR